MSENGLRSNMLINLMDISLLHYSRMPDDAPDDLKSSLLRSVFLPYEKV